MPPFTGDMEQQSSWRKERKPLQLGNREDHVVSRTMAMSGNRGLGYRRGWWTGLSCPD